VADALQSLGHAELAEEIDNEQTKNRRCKDDHCMAFAAHVGAVTADR
jgi:hypothetical protein